jgi:hypothetical protein
MPARDELPSTLQRSPKKAQETWSKAHDSAVDSYGEGERAHRTAFAALKQHLYDVAGRLRIAGRSRMSKNQLVDAIEHANERRTRRSREQS